MKKIIAILAALIMGLSLAAAPANAVTAETTAPVAKVAKAWGTSVTHAADDSGYTAKIQVICTNGVRLWLAPGEGTFLQSGSAGCPLSGVEKIVVGYDQTVYCKNLVFPYENTYFYTGTNQVPSNRTYKCYMQRPL